MKPIPFNRPALAGRELEYITAAMSGGHASGDGPFTRRCQDVLESQLAGSTALLTTSCTHALEMAALLLDVGPGDEIILPAFTFVSTASAFALRGATPIFADVRPDTLNIDERLVPDLVTPNTKAIVVVHYGGVACEMTPLKDTATRAGVALIEDNAHGLFGRYRGAPLGTLGRMATLSFHETKNVTCGEGGALLLNDRSLLARAEVIRDKGTNRSRFFRGEVDKYTWTDLGSSYPPADLLAAFLLAQLEAADELQAKRMTLWNRYRSELATWAGESGAGLPVVPPHCDHAAHLFRLMLPSEAARRRLMTALASAGILAVSHYVPLHLSPMGRRFGGRDGQCPVTEDASSRLLRLPLFADLTVADQDRVIDTIRAFHP